MKTNKILNEQLICIKTNVIQSRKQLLIKGKTSFNKIPTETEREHFHTFFDILWKVVYWQDVASWQQ